MLTSLDISGLSWFGVELTNNLLFESRDNQAQPEPNRVAAAVENSSLNFSKEPKFELMASDKNLMDDYKVFRERYLNIYTFCKTYNIFPGYSQYIENKLNSKQVNISGLFDTIDIDDIDLKNSVDWPHSCLP